MQQETNLKNLLDTFGSNLEEFIKQEVQKQVSVAMNLMDVEEEEAAVASDDNSSQTTHVSGQTVGTYSPVDDTSDSLQGLEDLLNDFKSTSKPDTINNRVDDLVISLDSLDTSPSIDAAPQTNEKKTGIGYAMNLLQKYKNKSRN